MDRRSLMGGAAVGLFVAFTPTFPFQMLLAAAGAIWFRVNLPLAVTACWITNPLTAVPIYMSAWRLGRSTLGEQDAIRGLIDLFAGQGRAGSFIRNSVYLWCGSLVYSVGAAAGGSLLVRLAWDLTARIKTARRDADRRTPARAFLRSCVLLGALLAGAALQKAGAVDIGGWIDSLMRSADVWWMPALLVIAMTAMYVMALPGSTLILVAGVLYSPPAATAIAVLSGVAGSWGAYFVAGHMSASHAERHADSRLFRTMRSGAGFSLLAALRLLPGFPHAVINYSAGALGANLTAFLASTLLGFVVKGFVYASAANRAAHIDPGTDLWSLHELWPLMALAVLAIGGVLIERRLGCHEKPSADPIAPVGDESA